MVGPDAVVPTYVCGKREKAGELSDPETSQMLRLVLWQGMGGRRDRGVWN